MKDSQRGPDTCQWTFLSLLCTHKVFDYKNKAAHVTITCMFTKHIHCNLNTAKVFIFNFMYNNRQIEVLYMNKSFIFFYKKFKGFLYQMSMIILQLKNTNLIEILKQTPKKIKEIKFYTKTLQNLN